MAEISKNKVIEITDSIMKKLEEIEKEYQIKIDRGSVEYNTKSFHFNIKCRLENVPSEIEEDYQILRSEYGKKNLPELHSVIGNYDGRKFKIIGAKLRAKKYPILIENINNGKILKTTIHHIQDLQKLNNIKSCVV